MRDGDSVIRICLLIIAGVLSAAGLAYAKSLLIPFFIALFITYTLMPIVNLLDDKYRFPRWLAVTVTMTLAMILLGGLGFIISANFAGMVDNFEHYVARFSSFGGHVKNFFGRFGFADHDLPQFDLLAGIKPALGYFSKFSKALLDLVADGFLILIFVVFLISGGRISLPRTLVFIESDKRIRLYLLTKVGTSLATGVVTGSTLALCGVDLAFLFGLLAFCLNFIPTVGSIVAVFLPIPVIVVSAPSIVAGIVAFIIPGLAQFLIGNVLEPKVMGDNLDLHPVTLLLALMFWGQLWGIPGMLLAAPLTVIAKVALSVTQRGHAISELMAGRIASEK